MIEFIQNLPPQLATFILAMFPLTELRASIPIALKDAVNKKKIKKNNLVVIAGYGVGLSWGSALIKWDKIK